MPWLARANTRKTVTRRPSDRLFVAALIAGTLPGIFSYVAVGIAVPGIARDFGIGPQTVQWVASAYIAAMMGGMLIAGALLARIGLRGSLRFAAVVFSLASLWAAMTDGFWPLVAARFLMGLAGGLGQPLALVVMYEAWPANERGKATALSGVAGAAVATLSPSLAGVLVDTLSWRAIFAAPIPLALAFLLAAHYAPARARHQDQPFDFIGLIAIHAGLLALLSLDLRQPFASPATLAALAILGASGSVLLWRQRSMRAPLFDPALYRHPAYVAASVCALLYGALLFGLSYLLPIHFQLGLGLSATAAGLWLIAPGVAVVTAIHFAGQLTDRLSFRPVLAAGFVLAALGTGALAIDALAGTVLAATAWAIVARSGTGLVFCALNTGATRVVPESLLPQVPGATNFFRILGGGLGVKAVSLFMDSAPPAEATVPAQAVAASSGGFAAAFLLMTLLAGIALLATWYMRPLRDGE